MIKNKNTLALLMIVILLAFINVNLKAQNITSGKEFINKNGTFKYVIGEDKTSFYVLRLGTKGSGVQNNIEKYNKTTFQMDWVKDVAFEKDLGDKIPSGDQFLSSSVILSRGKIYFFLSLLEPRKNMRSVYVKSLKVENGDIMGPAQLLAQEEDYKGTDKFSLAFSSDTTKILIKTLSSAMLTYNIISKVKLVELKNNNVIFEKDLPKSDNTGALQCTSVTSDNVGNLLCIYTRNGESAGLGKIALNSNAMNGYDLNISVNDHAYLTTNNFQYQENFNYAVITGIFIDIPCKGKKNCVRKEGNFFMKIDLNKAKVINQEYQYFDDKMHEQYKDLFDGMNDYKRLFCITSIIDKRTEDVYNISVGHHQAIVATKYDKEGKVIWSKMLPREGITSNSAFAYALNNGKLYFIYLDHPKNMENVNVNDFAIKDVKSLSAVTGANVICVSITKEGVIERKLLSTNEKDTANFNPESYDNLSEQPPIYLLRNRDKEKFIRFDF